MKPPLYCLPLFQILFTPAPCPLPPRLQLQPPCFFAACFYNWMGAYPTFDLYMDLHMSNLGTLIRKQTCSVFYATRYQVYGGLAHNVVWPFFTHFMHQYKSSMKK